MIEKSFLDKNYNYLQIKLKMDTNSIKVPQTRVMVFFIYQNPFIAKVNIETTSYITFQSLYPLTGISGDYFNDNLDLTTEEAYQTLKACLFTNLLPFHVVNRSYENLMAGKLDKDDDSFESSVWEELDSYDKKYCSRNSLDNLKETLEQYKSSKVPSFKSHLETNGDEETGLENMTKIVVQQKIDNVLFFNYRDKDYSGLDCTLELDLKQEKFPEEKILQEIYLWKWSAPRIGQYEDPFSRNYFRTRFMQFNEMKKMSLFLHCKNDKSLCLYDEILATWWQQRY